MAQRDELYRRWEPSRSLARIACVLFAIIGALPLLGSAMVSSTAMRAWAARETRRVLEQELGVNATYEVTMQLWPIRLAVQHIIVPANDGGSPVFSAGEISVTPRLFPLLSGRLDIGDIDVDQPKIRAVLVQGELKNLDYRLKPRAQNGKPLERAPFASIALTDASLDLQIDGTRVVSGLVDVDVFAGTGLVFEVGVNATETQVFGVYSTEAGTPRLTRDTLCQLDIEARLEPNKLFIQRLSLMGAADAESEAAVEDICRRVPAEQRLSLRAFEAHIVAPGDGAPLLDGQIAVRLPASLANRYTGLPPLTGWASFDGQIRYDGTTRLPTVQGSFRGQGLGLGNYRLAQRISGNVVIRKDIIHVPTLQVRFADGDSVLENAQIKPFEPGVPLSADSLRGTGMRFESLMRDVDVTPDTIVRWALDKTDATGIAGTLDPLRLSADVTAQTSGFEIFDRAFHDPQRQHIVGVQHASVRTRIGVTATSLDFSDSHIAFGNSTLDAPLVSVGFDNRLTLKVNESTLDLADVSPLVTVPLSGKANLTAQMDGPVTNTELSGGLAIVGFEFGGFPIGNILESKVSFKPLKLEFTQLRGEKNLSRFSSKRTVLDFDTDAAVVLDSDLSAASMNFRDFFEIWHFEADPRFAQLHGQGAVDAQVHYVVGGKQDACRSGALRVDGAVALERANFYEEHYTGGQADFSFHWKDMAAGYRGLELQVPALTLRKGEGTLQGAVSVEQGARVSAKLVASGIPLDQLDALPQVVKTAVGRAYADVSLSGTLDELEATGNVRVTPTRIGSATLPASAFALRLEPHKQSVPLLGTSRCGNIITPEFSLAEFSKDLPLGTFHLDGQLFGGQIALHDLRITRQNLARVAGGVDFNELDLGALSQLFPTTAERSVDGRLRASLAIADGAIRNPAQAQAALELKSLWFARSGIKVSANAERPLVLGQRTMEVPNLQLQVKTLNGQEVTFDVKGSVSGLGRESQLDVGVFMRDLDLGALVGVVPDAQRARGSVRGQLRVLGSLDRPRYQGGFQLEGGEVQLRDYPVPISDIRLDLAVNNNELKLTRASARLGSGTLSAEGSAPVHGFSLGTLRLKLRARNVLLEPEPAVRARFDADLMAEWKAALEGDTARALPKVTGDVELHSFEYTRPVRMSADLAVLTKRGHRTDFEVFDPDDDAVDFDVVVRSTQPLKLENNLLQASLLVGGGGLTLAGTNQRFGARGDLLIQPGGHLVLRQTEFEITEGRVRFNDTTRLQPEVDVTAVTEYRRYSESTAGENPTGTGATSTTSATGGFWRITMHAYGDADELKIDLKSDPILARDDIFLLLTIGLTRAELDQAQSASVGGSVALEALGTLSGADRVVTEAVPVIDDFRFGSTYSSRKGRTEPTVTIGKRLADCIRATVTTGLADSRDVRSNLEWRLGPQVSLEGSYDNVHDVSSSSFGNLGADILWRLEFE